MKYKITGQLGIELEIETVDPPEPKPIIELGKPFTTTVDETTTGERLTVPITKAQHSWFGEGVSFTVLDILEDGVSIQGFPHLLPWDTSLAVWSNNDPTVDPDSKYLFAGILTQGGSVSFRSQGPRVNKYTVTLLDQVSAKTTFHNPTHAILRTRGNPIGTSFGPGSSDILDHTTTGFWEEEDVARYGIVAEQPLERLRPSDPDRYTTDIDTRAIQYPYMLGLVQVRHDLAMFPGNAGDPTKPYLRPNEALGSNDFPIPTLAMGATPRNARPWEFTVDFLAKTENGGWKQDPQNKHHTTHQGQSILTCPYRIFLDPIKKTWAARENQMDYSNLEWLDLYTDYLVKWRQSTEAMGYLVGPPKPQNAAPREGANERFYRWLYHNGNPGWDVATDSGGTRIPSWGRGRTFYDLHTNTLLQSVQSSWIIVSLLRQKDPTAHIAYDPLPAHIPWGDVSQEIFAEQWAAESLPGTTAQEYYIDGLKRMADKATEILFPDEKDFPALFANDYIPYQDRCEIRSLENNARYVRYPNKNQGIL